MDRNLFNKKLLGLTGAGIIILGGAVNCKITNTNVVFGTKRQTITFADCKKSNDDLLDHSTSKIGINISDTNSTMSFQLAV